jgi:hypothetical protein
MKFIDIFEYYLAAYASQHAKISCAELLKGLFDTYKIIILFVY